jgi:hypothetical protein
MKGFAACILAILAAMPPAWADDAPVVNADLALAMEYVRACPDLTLDDRRAMDLVAAPQQGAPSVLADAGESIDTFAGGAPPPPPPAPSPEPVPPPDAARPPPPAEEFDCSPALALFGPEGTRIRGLLKVRADAPQ